MDIFKILLMYMALIVTGSAQQMPSLTPPPATPVPVITQAPATETPAPEEVPVKYTTLRPGDDGANVVKLQEKLIELGFLQSRADGRYGNQTKAVLMKTGPFNIEKFTGYCVLSSMFLQQYNQVGGFNRLVYTEPHPTMKNTIICRNWLKDGYDVEMTFNDEDPLLPVVTMERAVASDQGSFFGTVYGEWGDKLYVQSSALAQSIYYPLGGYLYVWTEISVEEFGVVGHFYNVMEWVSDEEAERIMREGF